MPLDERGKISAAVIAFYVPVAIASGLLVFRHRLRRDAGWPFLLLLALVRIVAGALVVADQEEGVMARNSLYVAAFTLYDAGLPILFLAAIGFLGLATQHTPRSAIGMMLKGKGLLSIIALVLSIAGDVESTASGGRLRAGMILRRIAAVLLAVIFVLLVFSHMHALSFGHRVLRARRSLLRIMFLALPFLAVRTAYYIMNAWSSVDLWGAYPSQNATLRRFNVVSGDWVPFLVMLLIMEYVAVLVYLISSAMINFHRDHDV